MNIKGVIKYAVSMLYRKRGFFLLEIFMTVLSVCLLNHAFAYYYVANRGIIDLKNNIDVDIDELYKVYFGNLANLNNENGEAIYNFVHALSQMDEAGMAGKYYRETISVTEPGKDAGVVADTLFVDEPLLGIHLLKNEDGKSLMLYENGDWEADCVSLAVGYNFRDSMPVGSKWTDAYYGRSYVVTDVIRHGETWMSTNIISEGEYELCLDNMFLTLSDDTSFLRDGYMTCFMFANNVFFMPEEGGGDRLKEQVRKLGQETGCPVVVQSVREIIENYKGNYREVYREVNFQVFMMTIMTVIGIFMTMLISLNIQKNNIRVMHIYGVSLKEHIIIHILNQGITFAGSYVLSYLISHQRLRNLYADEINYADKVMPYTLTLIFLLFVVTELVASGKITAFLDVSARNGE